jgi:serine protease Do
MTSRFRFWILAGSLVVAGTSLAFTQISGGSDKDGKREPVNVHLVVDNTPIPRQGNLTTSFAPMVKKVSPSVVKVFTTTKPKNVSATDSPFLSDPFFRRFFGEQFGSDGTERRFKTPAQHGLGSGVLVTKDGYILTNNHVVENADDIRVALTPDRKEYTAKVVGTDPRSDLAVLKIDADKDLPYATLGDSDGIEIGDLVLAIGNPFGIGQTVTMGMVSATGRATLGLDYEDFIQTDAAINPGNSGGALVDAEGRLIGINTAILSRSGGNNGIGFAIPVNLARTVMQSLVEHGHVVRGFLGVLIQDVTPDLAREFNLPDSHGALVTEVNPDTPAEKADLKTGDVIVRFDGKKVDDSRHLKLQVAQTAPGSKVPVEIIRDGKSRELTVRLEELQGDKLALNDEGSRSNHHDPLDGVTVSDLDRQTRRDFDLPGNLTGALVTRVDENSAAYMSGLREGDVILEIDHEKVKDADQAVELSDHISKKSVLLRIWSKGGSRFMVVNEDKIG